MTAVILYNQLLTDLARDFNLNSRTIMLWDRDIVLLLTEKGSIGGPGSIVEIDES